MGQNPILLGGVESFQGIDEIFNVAHDSDNRAEGKHPVGTRGQLPDGRVFFYGCSDATGITRAQLAINTTLNLGTGHFNIAIDAARAVGDETITADFTTTDLPSNFYKDGYLYVNDVDGEGQMFRIVSHNEQDVSVSTTRVTFALDRKITVALTTNSQITAIRNPFQSMAISTTGTTDFVVGVPHITVGASGARTVSAAGGGSVTAITTRFVWVQTWGPVAVLTGDTSSLGRPVMSGTAAGEVNAWVAGTGATPPLANMLVGTALHAGVDTEYHAVDLMLRP